MNSFFAGLVGESLAPWLTGFLVLLFIVLALWVMVAMIGRYRHSVFVSGGRKNRLQVVDATAIDDRRRLVLVRRDGVEHLVMIGGHNDLVIEKGIAAEAQTITDTAAMQKAAPVSGPKTAPTGRKLTNMLGGRREKPKADKPETGAPIDETPPAPEPAKPQITKPVAPVAASAASAGIAAPVAETAAANATQIKAAPVVEKPEPIVAEPVKVEEIAPTSPPVEPKPAVIPQDTPKTDPGLAKQPDNPNPVLKPELVKPKDAVEELNFDEALADIAIESTDQPPAQNAVPVSESDSPEMKERAKSLEGEMEKLLSELTVQR